MEYSTWKAVVLIPNVGWDYRVINLVEVVTKMVTVILNFSLATFITFHKVLRGLWVGCGTGNTSLEAKLIHLLMVMREEVL